MSEVSPGLPPMLSGWADKTTIAIGGTVCGGGIPPAITIDPMATTRGADQPTASIFGDPPTLPGYAPCGCYVGAWWSILPPPRCALHGGLDSMPAPTTTTTTTLRLTTTSPLSDADVDRIARRVVELLREERG